MKYCLVFLMLFCIGLQCMDAGKKYRRYFTSEEDATLGRLVMMHGQNWNMVGKCFSEYFEPREPRALSERWKNYLSLRPANTPWTEEDDSRLSELVEQQGHHWDYLSKALSQGSSVHSSSDVKTRYYKLRAHGNNKDMPFRKKTQLAWQFSGSGSLDKRASILQDQASSQDQKQEKGDPPLPINRVYFPMLNPSRKINQVDLPMFNLLSPTNP